MKPFRSIRWRLQAGYGLLLAVILLGFGFTAYQAERAALLGSVDDELHNRLFELARSLRPVRPPPGPPDELRPPAPPEGEPNEPPVEEDGVTRNRRPARPHGPLHLSERESSRYEKATPGNWYFIVWTHHGAAPLRSPGAPADLAMPARPETHFRSRGLAREGWLFLQPGDCLLVGRSMTGEAGRLVRLGWLLSGAGLAILGLGWLGGGWIVGRSLGPIADIGAAAAKIAGGDLSQRIRTADTDSELGQLAGVLNSTFARLDAAFAQQAQFTADAAHELRTPVTVILTHTQNALTAECTLPQHREAFEACHRASSRMRRLIESLLQLARLDAGQEALQRTPFDLAMVAEDCVELIRPLAAERRIALKAEFAASPCRGDPERIRQVITNLLTNAIDYNVSGGEVRVSVGLAAGQATLVVADNGPGIAAEHLPHIFDRFYRVDRARTTRTGRTGLGLSIVKAIVEAHGGTVGVTSELAKGATFTVTVPSG